MANSERGLRIDRYTEATRRALFEARVVALRTGREVIEAKDLLWGLITSPGIELWAKLSVDKRSLVDSLMPQMGHMQREVPERDVPLSKLALEILFSAEDDAEALGHGSVSSADVIAALCSAPEIAEILRAHGVSVARVRDVTQV